MEVLHVKHHSKYMKLMRNESNNYLLAVNSTPLQHPFAATSTQKNVGIYHKLLHQYNYINHSIQHLINNHHNQTILLRMFCTSSTIQNIWNWSESNRTITYGLLIQHHGVIHSQPHHGVIHSQSYPHKQIVTYIANYCINTITKTTPFNI